MRAETQEKVSKDEITKRERKNENLFAPMQITNLVKLPVVMNECDHIGKLLTRIIRARCLARQQSAEK